MTRLFFFLFLGLAPLLAQEELVVSLSSESDLVPVYLSHFKAERSSFDPSYLEQLEGVLRFDLAHDGTHCVLAANAEAERVAASESEKAFKQEAWKRLHVDHVVKGTLSGNQLKLALYMVSAGQLRLLEPLTLSGKLAEDRRQLHAASDALHQALVGRPGIAQYKILYTVRTRSGQNSSEWKTDIWEADYDGENARKLTHEGALCVAPVYLPSTGRGSVLYVSYLIGQPKLFLTALDGSSKSKRVTLMRGNQLAPAVSAQGNQVAFISDLTGNPELFLLTLGGATASPRQIFSEPRGVQGSPSFSPDGKELAFVSNKDGFPRIYTLKIPAAGTPLKEVKTTLISKQMRENTCPAWSPDGKRIAYSALTAGVRQIWVYDCTTKKETQWTYGPGHKENPAWAPNSRHLLFNSASDSGSELYLIFLGQREGVRLSKQAGEKRFPQWTCK